MKPLIVLITVFALVIIFSKIIWRRYNWKQGGRIAMAAMLLFTAAGHFVYAEGMQMMIPPAIPFKREIVLFTGVLEIVFAIGLLFTSTSYWVGLFLLVFFILVLPANVYAALNGINYQNADYSGPGVFYLWFRIPLQLFFIAWVWFFCIKHKN